MDKNIGFTFTTFEEWKQFQASEQQKDFEKLNAERNTARLKKLFDRACVPQLHQNCQFENYQVTNQGQQSALKVARFYADRFDEQLKTGRGMIFHGTTGTGKNHLASAIANQLLSAGYSVLIIKLSDLMSRFRASYDRDNPLTEEKLTRELVAVDLLVLDEIGVSHGSKDEDVQLNRIIDNRVNSIKPTMALTNLTLPEFGKRVGARNYDRLLANGGAAVEFNWESHRRQGAA